MDSSKNSSRGRHQGKKTTQNTSARKFDSKKRFSKSANSKPTYRKLKPTSEEEISTENKVKDSANEGGIRLNKYISNSGVCSRREADVYIKAGSASVNGKLINEMGFQVMPGDVVKFDGSLISPEKKRYVLLNKPKNFITTMDDDRGRKTVMELVSNASKERIYPVGRLDRNTTGLLLFTNDGEIAKKLTHPKHNIQKLYHASLDKKLAMSDMQKIADGFILDEKRVLVDEISYIMNQPKSEVGVRIHSGRNRIVRRIFENFNYSVVKLDRVIFAGLTKKDLPRGHWRHLTELEVSNLMML